MDNKKKPDDYDQVIEVRAEDIETDYPEQDYPEKTPEDSHYGPRQQYNPYFQFYSNRGCGCGCLPLILILLGLFALLDRLF